MTSRKLFVAMVLLVAMLSTVSFAGTEDSSSLRPFGTQPVNQHSPEALKNFYRGIDAFMNLDDSTAIEYLTVAVQKNVETDWAFIRDCYYYLSTAYEHIGDLNTAEEYILLAIDIDPTCSECWYSGAAIYAQGEGHSNVQAYLNNAVAHIPEGYTNFAPYLTSTVHKNVVDNIQTRLEYQREFLGYEENHDHFNANVFFWHLTNKLHALQLVEQTDG